MLLAGELVEVWRLKDGVALVTNRILAPPVGHGGKAIDGHLRCQISIGSLAATYPSNMAKIAEKLPF